MAWNQYLNWWWLYQWGFKPFTWGQFHRKYTRYLSLIWICKINSLWPSDAIWRQRSVSHYLNQCWLIIVKVQWHSSECNFTRDTSAISHWIYLENYSYKILLESPRVQWVYDTATPARDQCVKSNSVTLQLKHRNTLIQSIKVNWKGGCDGDSMIYHDDCQRLSTWHPSISQENMTVSNSTLFFQHNINF